MLELFLLFQERAQAAFDAVKKAYEVLEDEKTRAKCMEIVEEAEGRTKMSMEEKRKQLRKQGQKVRISFEHLLLSLTKSYVLL